MLADLSTAFIAVLPQIIWNVTISFHGGPVICKFLRFLQVSVDLAEKQHDRQWLPLTAVSGTTKFFIFILAEWKAKSVKTSLCDC